MTEHIPFSSLYKADHGWLQSNFHFSFAEYRDPNNISFGPLRVMNDDRIQGYTGFDTHPHRDMEIITYVIQGQLTHQDSMGHKETLGRGCVQYLSAGTGITHSEKNDDEEEIHLIQTWILPKANALEPQYGSVAFDQEQRHNKWLHIVGPKDSDAPINIYQDASMYVCELDSGTKLTFDTQSGRQLFVKLMEGSATINNITCTQGDALKVLDEPLHIQSDEASHILLVEMEKSQ
ncbi:MAG: pirin family protein [Thiovulaceae bacterium]|nr:pirin family protein [Sulfurimonadaceae bacterium]